MSSSVPPELNKMERDVRVEPTTSQTPPSATPVEMGAMPPAVFVCNKICFPWNLICGWQTVNQREVVVNEYCGVVVGIHNEPGCFFQECCCLTERRVTTSVQSMDLPNTKIVDSNGSPIMVSAILNYQVHRPLDAIYSVQDYNHYVMINAQAVVKSVIGKHPYNTLKTETEQINIELANAMQPKVDCTGVQILSVALNELNYAPEIAASSKSTALAPSMISRISLKSLLTPLLSKQCSKSKQQEPCWKPGSSLCKGLYVLPKMP